MTLRVGWLADRQAVPGGAEMTQAEFRQAAPHGVEVVDVGPDRLEAARGCDVAVVHNSVTYPRETIGALEGRRVVRYWHDLAPHGDPDLTRWLCEHATSVFCSELHARWFPHPHNGHELVPPPVDLRPFRSASNGKRDGTVSVGAWMNPGKAPWRSLEVAPDCDFYGHGPFAPEGCEPVPHDELPGVLARYRTFVFLPTAIEPFGRTVAEAWAAGCRVITNQLVGAREWIERDPGALDGAAERFWQIVRGN